MNIKLCTFDMLNAVIRDSARHGSFSTAKLFEALDHVEELNGKLSRSIRLATKAYDARGKQS